jgi:hypothetical protein
MNSDIFTQIFRYSTVHLYFKDLLELKKFKDLGAEVVKWLTTPHSTRKVWSSILASPHSAPKEQYESLIEKTIIILPQRQREPDSAVASDNREV